MATQSTILLMESALHLTDIIFLSYFIFLAISLKSISTIENTGKTYYVRWYAWGKEISEGFISGNLSTEDVEWYFWGKPRFKWNLEDFSSRKRYFCGSVDDLEEITSILSNFLFLLFKYISWSVSNSLACQETQLDLFRYDRYCWYESSCIFT